MIMKGPIFPKLLLSVFLSKCMWQCFKIIIHLFSDLLYPRKGCGECWSLSQLSFQAYLEETQADTGRTCKTPHWKAPGRPRESNPGPSSCEPTVLTITPPCYPALNNYITGRLEAYLLCYCIRWTSYYTWLGLNSVTLAQLKFFI